VEIIIASASQGIPLLHDSLLLAMVISAIASISYLFKKWLIWISVILAILVNIYWNVGYDEIMYESARKDYGDSHLFKVYFLFNFAVITLSIAGMIFVRKLNFKSD